MGTKWGKRRRCSSDLWIVFAIRHRRKTTKGGAHLRPTHHSTSVEVHAHTSGVPFSVALICLGLLDTSFSLPPQIRTVQPHHVEQLRFEASANDLLHRCGNKDPRPSLMGILYALHLNRSRTAWSNRRRTSRVMTAQSSRVSMVCALRVGKFVALVPEFLRQLPKPRLPTPRLKPLKDPAVHARWTNDGCRVSKQLEDAGGKSLWTTIPHRHHPVLHTGTTNFTPHLRGLRHIRVRMSFTAETVHQHEARPVRIQPFHLPSLGVAPGASLGRCSLR